MNKTRISSSSGIQYKRTLDQNNIDLCNECNRNNIVECCDKCGNGVCNNEKCAWLFPSHNNTDFIICNHCFEVIDKKLTPLVDYTKLQLLKKKINEKIEKQITMLPQV